MLKLRTVFLGVIAHLFLPALWAGECPRVAADISDFDKTIAAKVTAFESTLADPSDKKWVQAKIAHMVDIDQTLRTAAMDWPAGKKYDSTETECFWAALGPRWHKIDSANTEDLRELMKLYGWFTRSEFGEKTSNDVWLLAQHADHDRPFQRTVLALLEKLYPKKEVQPQHYAYLFDRLVCFADKLPQRYGTQGACHSKGDWRAHETEDPANLDHRRKAMGIGPSAEHKKIMDAFCK